jgi:hypothetical protein
MAERRAQQPGDEGDASGEAQQDQIVELRVLERDLEAAEVQRLTRETGQAILAAGDLVPAHGDEVEQLAERDRDHREVNAALAHHQRAEQGCGDSGCQRPDRDREWGAHRDVLQDEASTITAQAEPGRVTER